jgi:membrane-associated PAP2 superfamily phosphatase
MCQINKTYLYLIPLLIILVLTPFSADLDLKITRSFFTDGQFHSTPFLDFLYDYAFLPWMLLTLASFVLFILSYFKPSFTKWRKLALIPLLTIGLGSGLIVHAALKDHWGRPRPKQTIEFGGTQAFRPYYEPNFDQPEPSKSFPCGHCSVGFCFFSLGYVGLRMRNKFITIVGFSLAITLGVLWGYTRIVQGGHFFSDVIWGAAIMWWSTLFADWLLFRQAQQGFYHDNINEKTA